MVWGFVKGSQMKWCGNQYLKDGNDGEWMVGGWGWASWWWELHVQGSWGEKLTHRKNWVMAEGVQLWAEAEVLTRVQNRQLSEHCFQVWVLINCHEISLKAQKKGEIKIWLTSRSSHTGCSRLREGEGIQLESPWNPLQVCFWALYPWLFSSLSIAKPKMSYLHGVAHFTCAPYPWALDLPPRQSFVSGFLSFGLSKGCMHGEESFLLCSSVSLSQKSSWLLFGWNSGLSPSNHQVHVFWTQIFIITLLKEQRP